MRTRAIALGAAGGLLLAGGAGAAVLVPGRLARHQTGNGRLHRPSGRVARVGHFPTGGALTPSGRIYFAVSTGRAYNDIRSVRLVKGKPKVVQVLGLPGASGGIVLDAKRQLAYVSGLKDSENADEQRPGFPGRQGDVVHVIHYDRRGRMQERKVLSIPPPANAPQPQNFPPTNVGDKVSYPERIALSGDGKTLLAALNLADAAAVVNTQTGAVSYVDTGRMPYGAAILPGAKTGLITNETPGTLSVIDLASKKKIKDIQIGSHLSHAEEITLDNRHHRAFVPLANTDQVAVVDTKKLTLARSISVERPEGRGVSPVDTAVNKKGTTLYVAEASADELAVVPLGGKHRYHVTGRIPTAAYPADVQVGDEAHRLAGGQGLRVGREPERPEPVRRRRRQPAQAPAARPS